MLVFNKDFGLGTMNDQGGGAVINNQDMTITTNGEYTADEGYTGIGTATVNVPEANVITALNNTSDSISSGDKVWIKENGGSYSIENFYKQRNFTVLGSPTVNDTTEIVSNITGSNFLQAGIFNFNNLDYEVVVKIKVSNAQSGGYQGIFGANQSYIFGISLNSTGCIHVNSGNNGSSWSGGTTGTTVLETNKWYLIKVTRVSGERVVSLSDDDGLTWSNEGSRTDTNYYMANATFYLGRNQSSSEYFHGIIDLSNTYVKIKNQNPYTPYVSNITQNYLTGTAKESIASGSTGQVETVLPE